MSSISRKAVIVLILLANAVAAQTPTAGKRPLGHGDYDAWQSLVGQVVSRDGRHVAFTVQPQVGDGELIVRSIDGARTWRHPRGTRPVFSADGRFVVFRIEPSREEKRAYEWSKLLRKKKKAKKKSAGGEREDPPEEPLAGLGILDLTTGDVTVVPRVMRFQVPAEGPAFVVHHLEKPAGKDKKRKKKEEQKPGKPATTRPAGGKGEKEAASRPSERKSGGKETPPEEEKRKDEREGSTLVIRELATGKERRVTGVVSFGVTPKKGFVWYARSSKKKDPKITQGLFAEHLESGRRWTLVKGGAFFKHVTVDREVTRLVFLSNRRDREAEKPTYDLHAWDFEAPAATRIVSHTETPGFPKGRSVSPDASPRFSRDGSVVLFGACELPREDLPDVLAEDEVKLDIWSWKDPLLQPMQAKRAQRRKTPAVTCAWHFDAAAMAVLGRHEDERISFMGPDGSRALVLDGRPYAQEVSWDGSYQDVYVVGTLDGSRRKILSKLRSRPLSSPDGRYVLAFRDRRWICIDLEDGRSHDLTGAIGVAFHDEEWDLPQEPRAYGVAGWTPGEEAVLIYDRYDLWSIKPDGSAATCVTEGFGRAAKVRLRYQRLDPDERFIPADREVLLSAFDEETMASGYYGDRLDLPRKPRKLVMLPKAFRRLRKAREADVLIFNLSTFQESPDLWTADMEFKALRRLSELNPQQKDFLWGKAETVRWHSADGVELKGTLIKPEGFDPRKKYPLMVYFYERLSQRLHSYRPPAPGTSPNATYYVSNGYLWFEPDIVYRVGYPGESCVKCVVSGVQHLIDQGFVDENAIGAAGHSWGGYQTAYLITETDIFAAVESGAPVSNMTSAYGGIRWGSGMSRAFQYERTQSRIGGSLWRYPLRYIENSPVFHADKVRTPILMMHNDQDGAVPWYQGIEYFCALRRLGREAYMFNYVGAGHGLRRRADLMDWTMRMQQFFDHHLRGHEAPEWMKRGVPYRERKEEKFRFRPPPGPPGTEAAAGADPVR